MTWSELAIISWLNRRPAPKLAQTLAFRGYVKLSRKRQARIWFSGAFPGVPPVSQPPLHLHCACMCDKTPDLVSIGPNFDNETRARAIAREAPREAMEFDSKQG